MSLTFLVDPLRGVGVLSYDVRRLSDEPSVSETSFVAPGPVVPGDRTESGGARESGETRKTACVVRVFRDPGRRQPAAAFNRGHTVERPNFMRFASRPGSWSTRMLLAAGSPPIPGGRSVQLVEIRGIVAFGELFVVVAPQAVDDAAASDGGPVRDLVGPASDVVVLVD